MNAEIVQGRQITKDTLVPIGVVSGFLIILIGGVLWLSEIRSIAASNKEQIIAIHEDIDEINDSRAEYRKRLWESIRRQDERLARIEGKLQVIYDTLKKKD